MSATKTLQEANEERMEAYGALHDAQAESAKAELRYLAVYLIELFAAHPEIERVDGIGQSDGDATGYTVFVNPGIADDALEALTEFLNQFYVDVVDDGWMDSLSVSRGDVDKAGGDPAGLVPVLLNGYPLWMLGGPREPDTDAKEEAPC